jgi:hypothetical protein
MNFTPKIKCPSAIRGILIISVVAGLIGWIRHVAPASAPIIATKDAFAVRQTSDLVPIVPAVEWAPISGLQTAKYYQPIAYWYKNKHWWKRNAPIIAGAGGGALIGGLAGGGKGALIGGLVGGGGGYAYKRYRRHHHYHHY